VHGALKKNNKRNQAMNNRTHTRQERPQGKGTFNTKEILAYIPELNGWRLCSKVPYTKQTYEVKAYPAMMVTMDYLLEAARVNKEYPPVAHPVFVKAKYTQKVM